MALLDLLNAADERAEMQARGPEIKMALGWHPITLAPGNPPLSLDFGQWTMSVSAFHDRLRAGTARYAR